MDLPLSQEELIKKINAIKAGGADLSTEEDLSIAVMNLVSLEEHFFFTGQKTANPEYYNLLHQVREMRKALLARLMPENEGETWCIAKHLLAASMRLMEVGIKLQGSGQKPEAGEMFGRAYELYALFWALRLKLIDLSQIKKVSDGQHDIRGQENGKPWTKQDIVSKLVDCCNEN